MTVGIGDLDAPLRDPARRIGLEEVRRRLLRLQSYDVDIVFFEGTDLLDCILSWLLFDPVSGSIE